jgi:hypothetical protein
MRRRSGSWDCWQASDRVRLLDWVENFTLFPEHKAGLAEVIGQNHQFLGVNHALTSRRVQHGCSRLLAC